MPADIAVPLHPPAVGSCPNANLPPLQSVVPWHGSPPAGLQAWAMAQLRHPLGTVIRDTVGGVPVVARIECHFDWGAHPDTPGKWHKGTSVYRPATMNAQTGQMTAITSPPTGWPSSAV